MLDRDNRSMEAKVDWDVRKSQAVRAPSPLTPTLHSLTVHGELTHKSYRYVDMAYICMSTSHRCNMLTLRLCPATILAGARGPGDPRDHPAAYRAFRTRSGPPRGG